MHGRSHATLLSCARVLCNEMLGHVILTHARSPYFLIHHGQKMPTVIWNFASGK